MRGDSGGFQDVQCRRFSVGLRFYRHNVLCLVFTDGVVPSVYSTGTAMMEAIAPTHHAKLTLPARSLLSSAVCVSDVLPSTRLDNNGPSICPTEKAAVNQPKLASICIARDRLATML